jgi:uncharacterized membrane protein
MIVSAEGFYSDVYLFVAALMNGAIPVLITLAVLMFLFGLVSYVIARASKNTEKKKQAKSVMFYALVTTITAVIVFAFGFFLSDVLVLEIY